MRKIYTPVWTEAWKFEKIIRFIDKYVKLQ